jgi:hypothetical protein
MAQFAQNGIGNRIAQSIAKKSSEPISRNSPKARAPL